MFSRWRARLKLAVVGCLAALLAGCGDDFRIPEIADVASGALDTDRKPACPPVQLLSDGATYTRFRPGPGRDLTDIELQADFLNVNGECGYRPANDGVNWILVQLEVSATVRRGPAARDASTDQLPYFVALLDPSDNIINKQVFSTEIIFPPGVGDEPQRHNKIVNVSFPIIGSTPGWAYQTVVGFQLTPEQLEYQRKFGR